MAFRHVIIRDQDGQTFPVTNETPAAQFGASLQGQGWTLVSTTGSATAPTTTTTPDTFPDSAGVLVWERTGDQGEFDGFIGGNFTPRVVKSVSEINRVLRAGGAVRLQDGSAAAMKSAVGTPGQGLVTEFGGGLLVNGIPINGLLDPASITDAQRTALSEGGQPLPDLTGYGTGQVPGGELPPNMGTPGPGTTNIPPPGPGTPGPQGIQTRDLALENTLRGMGGEGGNQDIIREGMIRALGRATTAPDALMQRALEREQGLFGDFKGQLARQISSGEQLFGRARAGLDQQLGLFNQGLSPQAQAAYRQQLTGELPREEREADAALRVELARRGAMGDQTTPGSAGDILRGFAPIKTRFAGLRAEARRTGILANEQQLAQNRQQALQALGTIPSQAAAFGQVFDPSALMGGAGRAGEAATGAFQAGTGGFGAAGQFAGALSNLDPNSFRNTLINSLGGAAIGSLSDFLISEVQRRRAAGDQDTTTPDSDGGTPWWMRLLTGGPPDGTNTGTNNCFMGICN